MPALSNTPVVTRMVFQLTSTPHSSCIVTADICVLNVQHFDMLCGAIWLYTDRKLLTVQHANLLHDCHKDACLFCLETSARFQRLSSALMSCRPVVEVRSDVAYIMAMKDSHKIFR